MTFDKVDSVLIRRDSDCENCGTRYYAECEECKKPTCLWCAYVRAEKTEESHICNDCHVSQERKETV